MIFIGIILAVLAVVLLVVGILAVARKLPGNPVIGLRVAEVRKSKETWDTAHHVAGTFWILGGVAMAFAALLSFVVSGWMWVLPVVLVFVSLVALGAGANVGARTAAAIDVANEVEADRKANEPAPAPAVDFEALRRAASQSGEDTGDGRGEAKK